MNLLRVQCCRAALPPPQARRPGDPAALTLSSNGANAASMEYSSRQPDLSSVQVGNPALCNPLVARLSASVRCHDPAREHDWRQHMSYEHVRW